MSEQAGIWLRVSSKGQDEESQRPEIMRWVQGHAYEMKAEYIVHGHSAFKGNRKFDKTWGQALDDLRSGKITVLVVWKQNRLDRKLNTFKMIAQVVEAGGRVEFVSQPHLNDLSTMGGRIALKVEEEIAYAESKGKSDNVIIKQNALRAAGSVVGRAPWGYEIVKRDGIKVFVPTAEGRKHGPVIFQMVIDGQSQEKVAEYLTLATGHKWNERYLPRLFRNPVYYGARRNAGQLAMEGLVRYEIWQAANAALKTRVKYGRRTTVHEKAFVSPMCGNPDCDATGVPPSPMYRVFTGRPNYRMPYYRCVGSGPQRKGCGNMVRCVLVDEWVAEAVIADPNPYSDRVFVAGDERADEIGRLRAAAMDAYFQGDRELFEKLDAEAEELANERAIPSRWVEYFLCYACGAVQDLAACVGSGHHIKTRGEHFAALRPAQRREELAQRWVVYADKTGVEVTPRNWP